MCKELGRLANGYKQCTTGTDTVRFLDINEIQQIPFDRIITHVRIMADCFPQKDDPFRIRITAGGNLINYPGETHTNVADMITAKILWNSILSAAHACFMTIDVGNFLP